MLVKLLAALGILTGTAAPAIENLDKSHSVTIFGKIDAPELEIVQKLAKASQGEDEVQILINSFGGAVIVSDAIVGQIEQLKARGVNVKCYVGFAAISAAFHILEHCSDRFVLAYSKLMFHPVRRIFSGEELRVPELIQVVQEMHKIDLRELTFLCDNMIQQEPLAEKMNKCKGLSQAYYQETIWEAPDLAEFAKPGFFKIIEDLDGAPREFYLIPKH